MNANKLKQLTDCNYVSHDEKYVTIGSPYIHDIMKICKKSLEIHMKEGSGKHGWDRVFNVLRDLKERGELREIVDGENELENPIPCYAYDGKGGIKESMADEVKWPNNTLEGEMIYDNGWFSTRQEAIDRGVENCKYCIEFQNERINYLQEQVSDLENDLQNQEEYLRMLEMEYKK